MDAVELAAGMGLDIDASTLRRRRRRQARKTTTDPGALGVQQAAFWESVQQWGRQHATHASFHRSPGRRHWANRIIRERPGDFRDPGQADRLVQWLVRTADDFVRVLHALRA